MNSIILVLATFGQTWHADEPVARRILRERPENRLLVVSTRIGDKSRQEVLGRVLGYLTPATSREPNLTRIIPKRIGKTIYVLDLDRLRWRDGAIPDNPYGGNVYRADYLISQLSTGRVYYDLMYGQPPGPPTTRIDRAVIEGESGVAVAGRRLIVQRGRTWETFDSKRLTLDNDAISNLRSVPGHDGRETIVVDKKHFRGEEYTFLRWALFNGRGVAILEAPGEAVTDVANHRGATTIRVPGSCIQCHDAGLKTLAAPETKTRQINREISRVQADYQDGVQLLKFDVAEYVKALAWYDAPLTLEAAAEELETTLPNLKILLKGDRRRKVWSEKGIPRATFEDLYLRLSR